ncbi:MAG: TrpB-like pyridoxal-phosphate dependent enzyme, partial [Bacteroidota bacterium]|nr:TrpB-like pyridoxal-phosphate dependent enzyme [Bacteroidota bacterium]
THAIASVIRQAKQAKEEGKEKVILFNFSGHGLMDLVGYDKFLRGELKNHELSTADFEQFTAILKNHPDPVV